LGPDSLVKNGNATVSNSASASLITELEEAVKGGSAEKRVETLRRVTDLFLDDADRLNEQQIGVFDDVLVHLIQRIENRALVQLSGSLATVAHAPIQVIGQLARNKEILIAGPVLSQSDRLTDTDLIEIARSHGQGHLLAISGRSSLNTGVTDVLIERGDQHVRHRLARNESARFSETGFQALVKRAEADGGLAEKLGRRIDIPFKLLRELLARATDAVRSRLLASAPPDAQQQIQLALASIVKEISQQATGPRNFTASDDLVKELNRTGKLKESVLYQFAIDRKYEEMTSTLALFCQARVQLVETLMKNSSSEGVVTACRAANLSWPTVAAILNVRFSHHSVTDQELAEAKEAFYALSVATAQRTVRFMMVKSATKQAS
jgi:uncharacterized protein (DUF2336 family)